MKDTIFTIYRYKVKQMTAMQLELFTDGVRLKPKDYATKELFFESFLPEKGQPLDIWKEIRKESNEEYVLEKDPYTNMVIEHREHIIILALQAKKAKKIYDANWGSHAEPNFPPFVVVFDNREGHQFLCIEHAAMDTDKSAELLQTSINAQMNRFGYCFEIVRLKRKFGFLDAVYHIKDRLKDNVNRVVFDFANNMEQKKQLASKFVHALTEWIGKFADSGQIAANISNDERLKEETIRQDLQLMAELCTENSNYNLFVKFEHFGLYRFGQDVKAQFGVGNDVLKAFTQPQEVNKQEMSLFAEEEESPKITLQQWLDDVKKLYLDYEEEALSVKKRKRTRRL